MKPKRHYKLARGRDVDLDREDVRDSKGRRITTDYAARAAEDAIAKAQAGRPSLSGTGQHSRRVSFRVPTELREAAEARAREEGESVSTLVRRALEEYLAS